MKASTVFVLMILMCGMANAETSKFLQWAMTPPMGRNSWECFGAGDTEQDAKANAEDRLTDSRPLKYVDAELVIIYRLASVCGHAGIFQA